MTVASTKGTPVDIKMSTSRSEILGELRALAANIKKKHLRTLLEDSDRNEVLFRSNFYFLGAKEIITQRSPQNKGPQAPESAVEVDSVKNSPSSSSPSSKKRSTGARGAAGASAQPTSSGAPRNLGLVADFTRQKVDVPILQKLLQYATEQCQLQTKILGMVSGEVMNPTENRKVLHSALRLNPQSSSAHFYAAEVRDEVLRVRNEVREFSEEVRSGRWVGITGKPLTDVLSIGIGGSYLGVEFVLEALKTEPDAAAAGRNRRTQFLANVDPIDIKRATAGLDPETTLVVICSKTFTTAETILNAESVVNAWLLEKLRQKVPGNVSRDDIVSTHVVAVSTNKVLTKQFGITKTFDFWDWVGGRFSVCSAVGLLPLSLQFGPSIVDAFLAGANEMDEHFFSAPLPENLPVLMGLVQFWNRSFLDLESCAILPYCQALHRFTAHIQQLDMESNGKRVTVVPKSEPVDLQTGATYFGEPGTNAQHSFYQLLHQGTSVIPAEFIGFTESQNAVHHQDRALSNHDELMANFFAQPNALALGRSAEEVQKGDPQLKPELVAHKTFPGDRPSLMLLFDGKCDARTVGLLLALYEHRTAVQGWLWGINSFDQYGVELGKVLAKGITNTMKEFRADKKITSDSATTPTDRLLRSYLHMSAI
ncbi:unnamed protein product [Amoebophrya sp. A120]|nr:unnamed protein product [Amoebophrya sp. A120]|eukprot:GSA120T00023003001.1